MRLQLLVVEPSPQYTSPNSNLEAHRWVEARGYVSMAVAMHRTITANVSATTILGQFVAIIAPEIRPQSAWIQRRLNEVDRFVATSD
jgi:hypothetical protein